MIIQFEKSMFWVELGVAVAWLAILWFASRHYNPSDSKDPKARTIKADYFKTPTGNALTILGLLVPFLVALAAYLYSKSPGANYSSLLTTIVLYFGVLIIAIWETFALLKKATDSDSIVLTLPADQRFLTGLHFMYGLLLLGLVYFAIFFLFEFGANVTSDERHLALLSRVLLRQEVHVDESREKVVSVWGMPSGENLAKRWIEYRSPNSIIRIEFDADDRVLNIVESRLQEQK